MWIVDKDEAFQVVRINKVQNTQTEVWATLVSGASKKIFKGNAEEANTIYDAIIYAIKNNYKFFEI